MCALLRRASIIRSQNILNILNSHELVHLDPLQMDDSYNGQRERDQLPGSVPHRGIDTTPDYKDDAHLRSTRAATQWRKEEGVRGKRMDSAPSIHSFMSASVLMPDKAVSASREDKVNTRSLSLIPHNHNDHNYYSYIITSSQQYFINL